LKAERGNFSNRNYPQLPTRARLKLCDSDVLTNTTQTHTEYVTRFCSQTLVLAAQYRCRLRPGVTASRVSCVLQFH